MKIAYVTGCLGFIGSHLTRRLLQLGWQIIGVDSITYVANVDLLDEFNKYKNFRFEKCDIKDLDKLYDCDYVFNLAAETHVGNSIIKSDEFVYSNILGVKNLLDLIKSKPLNVGSRPILFHVSTDEVYGDIVEGYHKETDVLNPSNPYSAAKAAADLFIQAWHRTYGIDYFILRPTNNYGQGQYPEKLIPLSIKNLRRGKKIKLHNKGAPVRTWLHVEDTVNAILRIVDNGEINQIYNVSSKFEQKNIETVKQIIDIYYDLCYDLERENWKKHVDIFDYIREGQDIRYALDDNKLRALHWKEVRNFKDELTKIVSEEIKKEVIRW